MMADDLQSTLNEALDSLQASQRQVAALKQQLAKTAAVKPDSQLVEQTVAALKKVGSITDQEAAQATELLSSDPNAALRCINGLVTAQDNIKKTASESTSDVFGAGNLVGQTSMTKEAKQEESIQKFMRILRHETTN